MMSVGHRLRLLAIVVCNCHVHARFISLIQFCDHAGYANLSLYYDPRPHLFTFAQTGIRLVPDAPAPASAINGLRVKIDTSHHICFFDFFAISARGSVSQSFENVEQIVPGMLFTGTIALAWGLFPLWKLNGVKKSTDHSWDHTNHLRHGSV